MSEARAMDRRRFLRQGALALGVQALPALAAPAPDFTFAVVNDLHYRDERCGPWFERVVRAVRALRPAFVVLAGDLSEDGSVRQLGAVDEIFRPLPMPLHRLIGNHDYTPEGSRAGYERLFGTRRNYRFAHGGCQFLALDSTAGRRVYRTRIPDETLAWLRAERPALSKTRPLIVLTHFPLGRNWLRPVNAHAVLERLQGLPLQAAFSGHWHGLTERAEHGVHLSTGRCCSWWRTNHDGSPRKGFTLVQVRDGVVSHEFRAVET